MSNETPDLFDPFDFGFLTEGNKGNEGCSNLGFARLWIVKRKKKDGGGNAR